MGFILGKSVEVVGCEKRRKRKLTKIAENKTKLKKELTDLIISKAPKPVFRLGEGRGYCP